jgi:hypothetical protein
VGEADGNGLANYSQATDGTPVEKIEAKINLVRAGGFKSSSP